MSVIYHSSNSVIIAEFETTDKVINTVRYSNPRFGGNSFYQAVNLIENLISKKSNIKTMVLFLSDGGDCEWDS